MSRLHLKQVNKSSRGQQRAAILLYERDNHINDAGFPWSDVRLVVWACSAAARSRLALKRSSLSFEHSLDTLTAARLRWAARRSSLCSLSSLDRLTKFPAAFARRWHKNAPKPSHPRWRQYSITFYRHRPDKQSPTSNARPCAPRSSAPVSPRHHRTNKVRPRMRGAARLARTRVPNISPLTRGNESIQSIFILTSKTTLSLEDWEPHEDDNHNNNMPLCTVPDFHLF